MKYNKTIQKNLTLNHIQTKPFKSTKIRVAFVAPLERDTATIRAILPYIMRAASKKYPSRIDVSTKVNDMYAARFNVGVSKKGETHMILFELSIIDDPYTLFGESLFKEGLDFLHEMIYNPVLSEEIYNEEYRLMTEYYQSIYANKMRYAIQTLQDTMFENEPYRINALGDLETLNTLKFEDIRINFESMIKNDLMNITVVGDIDFDYVNKEILSLFGVNDISFEPVLIERVTKDVEKINVKSMIQDVEQAKLVLGYRLPVYYKQDLYYEAILFDMLFGGSSESLLFKKIREELGLVYSVQSSYNPYKGVFFIYLGINKEEYDHVLKEIDLLLKSIDSTTELEEYLDIAKKSYTNGLIQSYDSINGIAYKLEHSSLYEQEIDMDKTLNTIKGISLNDIKEVVQKLTLDTICFLHGEDNE